MSRQFEKEIITYVFNDRNFLCKSGSNDLLDMQEQNLQHGGVFKNGREKGALFGWWGGHRPRHDFAELNLYDRYVNAHRVPRSGGQFEFRVVLLHLRNACPSRFLKMSGVLSGPLAPPVSPPPATARGPPTPRAPRTAAGGVLAVPVGRCWLFQDFS